MRLKKLDILGIAYDVVESDEEECEELRGRYGYTDFDKRTIVIRKSDAIDIKQDTLLHEVGHAFIEESGLKAFFDSSLPKITDRFKWEECLLSLLTPHLVQLIKKNKSKLWITR